MKNALVISSSLMVYWCRTPPCCTRSQGKQGERIKYQPVQTWSQPLAWTSDLTKERFSSKTDNMGNNPFTYTSAHPSAVHGNIVAAAKCLLAGLTNNIYSRDAANESVSGTLVMLFVDRDTSDSLHQQRCSLYIWILICLSYCLLLLLFSSVYSGLTKDLKHRATSS